MRKNNFLTFCFAFIPGAGQMYLGMMKKGISIMTVFVGVIAIIGFLHFEIFALFLPVIWFYAFFDTFNIRNLSDEQIKEQDKFIFNLDEILTKSFKNNFSGTFAKKHKLIGIVTIFIGLFLLYDNFIIDIIHNLMDIYNLDYNIFYRVTRNIPTLIISIVIIIIGIKLIKGSPKTKMKLLEQKDDLKQFGNDK